MTARRLALYYAPAPDTLLAEFGRRWFRRDDATGESAPALSLPDFSQARLAELIRPAAVYGFHATLRSPIRLAPGASAADLHAAAEAIAARHRPIALDALELVAEDEFIGLMLPEDPPQLTALHLDCLESAELFRLADPRADEKRRAGRIMTASMDANLARWGYPYTGSDFRFHITLTGRPADAAERDRLADALAPMLIPARAGLTLDAVCVYEQPAAGADFIRTGRYPFA